MSVCIGNDWDQLLEDQWPQTYYQQLRRRLYHAYKTTTVYPAMDRLFYALQLVSYADCRVVILGQDPYHGPGQANGLAFSVHKGVAIPPSLQNIFRELEDDLGCPYPAHGDLTEWAKQGVLLLNATLSVQAHQANSHAGFGWQQLTDHIIDCLAHRENPPIFVFWGRFAQSKKRFLAGTKARSLCSAHPSPLSAYRGFFGSRPFSTINRWLEEEGMLPIHWCLESCDAMED